MINEIRRNFIEAQELLQEFIDNPENWEKMDLAGSKMSEAIQNGNKIFSCGNGGSMSDAMHFAEELTGRFRDNRKGISAIAISDPTHISCTANDFGYDFIFSRYLEALGRSGDVLLGISTSGNSQNVIEAVKKAKELGMVSICLTGKSGGKLANMCDIELRAPESKYADRAQEIHIKIIHSLIHYIELASI